MNYYIKRDATEYGPYTLADLQRYVAHGSIALTDLTRSEGLADWVPVSQVIGNIPVPSPAPAGYPGAPTYGAQPGYAAPSYMPISPTPPDFHWALVLLISFVSCGLFFWAWAIVEAAWVRKIRPGSSGLVLVILATVLYYCGGFLNGFIAGFSHPSPHTNFSFLSLIGLLFLIIGAFSLRVDLERYYNSTENIGLRLSGAMTFFLAVFYFQHHFSRIARWKKGGILEPQY